MIVSTKYSRGFSNLRVSPVIVVDRYLDYFTTIMGDGLWQVLVKPVFRWQNRLGFPMNDARAADQIPAVNYGHLEVPRSKQDIVPIDIARITFRNSIQHHRYQKRTWLRK